MLAFLTSKIGAYLLLGLLIASVASGGFLVIKGKAELAGVRTELVAERECRQGTACAGRRIADAEAAKAITDGVRADAEALRKLQVDALNAHLADVQSQLQREAASAARQAVEWQHKYQEALSQPACNAWSQEVVACPVN